MLLDLLSQSNYRRFNIKIAKLLGLQCAIYIEELMDINDKAIRKDKIRQVQNNDLPFGTDKNNPSILYFTVDRKYIEDLTTLKIAEQKKLDEKLAKLNIVKLGDSEDELSIDIEILTSLVMSKDEQLVKSLSHIVGGKAKTTKRECVQESLKSGIVCSNAELLVAYQHWVDGVFANPKGFLTKESIKIFQKTVDDFCNHNLDAALRVIEIATVNGYRDATWAIDRYKKEHGITGDKITDTYFL